MSSPSICVHGLVKRYGSVTAVNGIEFAVERGQIFALLGPNGSGKSTTVRCLSGLLRPDEGHIEVSGFRAGEDLLEIKKQTGVLVDGNALFPGLDLQEHLVGEALIRGFPRPVARKRAEDLLRFFDLWDARHRLAEHGSVGMRKKLGIAMALIHNPAVVILDEPFEGLDPVAAHQTADLLDRLRAEGTAILITSHILDLLARLADEVALIDQGLIRYRGSPTDLELRYREVFGGEQKTIPSWLA